MKPKRYENLITEIKLREPKTIIEIGTWNGHNAVKMIKAANNAFYYGFDLFENFSAKEYEFCPKKPSTLTDVKKYFYENKVYDYNYNLIPGNTLQTLLNPLINHPIDFIYMDGGHSLETVSSDWNNIQKWINEDTIIILDDYYDDYTEKGCHNLVESLDRIKWDIEHLEPADKTNEGYTVRLIKCHLNKQ